MTAARGTLSQCTLQINVAPGDWRHASQTLPHQLRQLGGQVSHVLITVDLQQPTGVYALADYTDARDRLLTLLDDLRRANPSLAVEAVDPSSQFRHALAERFSRGRLAPMRDGYGGPFHAYLQGLLQAPTDAVLHLDADMLLGGGSASWVREALQALDAAPSLLLCSPLAGPPTPDASLPHDVVAMHAFSQPFGSPPQAIAGETAYLFQHATTRAFLIRRDRLEQFGLVVLRGKGGLLDRRAGRVAAPLEVALSALMQRHGLKRLDMLGQPPGMWVLHPHVRTPAFYDGLAHLIDRVETGDVSDQQRGRYDLHRSMLDWGRDPSTPDNRPRWRRAVSTCIRRTPARSLLDRRARRFI